MTPPAPQRFTLDGTDALEARLAETCAAVRDAVRALVPRARLAGILLAGGYGRGEGGVLRTPAGDEPYNDMEFYVFVQGSALLAERRLGPALHALGEQLSPAAGLEVEFKVLTRGKLRRRGPNMFDYDLVAGHRWLLGDAGLLDGCDHHRDPARIPLHEATRLLMNRCSGLLFARERLDRASFQPADADFVGRNLAKAQLAFGDVLLTAQGQYHWSCRVRQERLARLDLSGPLAWATVLRPHHAAGVEFKLHPVRAVESRTALAARYAALAALGRQLWLWLENRRLPGAFQATRDYAASPGNKCPETQAWRNRFINLRTFGWHIALGSRGGRYPRERLLQALSLLLWESDLLGQAEWLRRLQGQLLTTARDRAGLVAAYTRLWTRFN